MALSDQELMLLEQLTYLRGKDSLLADKIGVNMDPNGTVEDWLNVFDEKALKKLENLGTDYDDYTSGQEMAAIIRAIKNDPDLMSLKIINNNEQVYATCFESTSGEAYVTFRGTSGGDEWKDDAEGLGMADTPCQELALDYIEGLPYDNITVVGHSKGGNKAQYVTIRSDKVHRCISMDGQGFSGEFLEKYAAEIQEKGGCIKNYSLSTDYVHILMYYVPGAEQIFCQGDPSQAGLKNHSPVSYYQYYQDQNGNWHIVMNGDDTNIIRTQENPGLTYLHDFTEFVLDNMPFEVRGEVGEYIGIILALAMDDHYSITIDGVTYTHDSLGDFILSDTENLSTVIAYVMKYADTYGLSSDQVIALLEAFGFKPFLNKIEEFARILMITNPALAIELGLTAATTEEILEWFLNLLKGEITDGMNDPVIEQFLRWINDNTGTGIDFVDLWRNIEKQYKAIGHVEIKTTEYTSTTGGSTIFDYSNAKYQQLMSVVRSVGSISYGSVSSWSQYSGEDWYPSLFIGRMATGISRYVEHMHEINENCAEQIEEIFDFVSTLDTAKSQQVSGVKESVKSLTSTLRNIY